ncbi:putative diacylglycerol O-acyltransferase [Helianthus anomalus]
MDMDGTVTSNKGKIFISLKSLKAGCSCIVIPAGVHEVFYMEHDSEVCFSFLHIHILDSVVLLLMVVNIMDLSDSVLYILYRIFSFLHIHILWFFIFAHTHTLVFRIF